MITTQGVPDLKDPDRWSPQMKDFLRVCLQRDPTQRPSAEELLSV